MALKTAKADLIYGATGTYKTSQIGHAALYILEKYQKTTRVVSADGGGGDDVLKSLIDAGIIEVWPIRLREHLIEAIDKACQGYWPADPNDPKSLLLPPTDKRNGLNEIGLIGFEGLTSFGSSVMTKLKKPGVQLSQDPAFVLRDGETDYAGGSMAAFGFVQDRIFDYVMKSHMIPFVEKVLWTGLEAKGEEEGTRIPIFGPAIEGKKATGKAGQWFGNMFHMEAATHTIGVDEASQQVRLVTPVYMYLKPHADANSGITFPAKARAPFQMAAKIPEKVLLTEGMMDKDSKPMKAWNLKMVYEALDKLQEEAAELVKGLKRDPVAAEEVKV